VPGLDPHLNKSGVTYTVGHDDVDVAFPVQTVPHFGVPVFTGDFEN
jgi:hypothetical protein